MMNYDELLKPYASDGRTLGGQIKWLLSKGIPQHIVDTTIAHIYTKISNGKAYHDGHELDQALLNFAKEMQEKDLRDQTELRINSVEVELDQEWNKLTKWQKIKQVLQGKA